MILKIHRKVPLSLIINCGDATNVGIYPSSGKPTTIALVPTCANPIAKYIYALLAAVKLLYPEESKHWRPLVKVSGSYEKTGGKVNFNVGSKNVLTLITKKINCHATHPDIPYGKVYETGPKIGADVALNYQNIAKTWDSVNVPLKMTPATFIKMPKSMSSKPKLNKVGYMDIVTTSIVADISLLGDSNKLHNLGTRDVLSAVYMFYAIEELYATGIVSKPRRDIYVDDIARSMFDYLASISLVEARHAKGAQWSIYVSNSGDTRSYAADKMHKFDPRQFLPITKHLFDEEHCWEGSFGGEPWAKIADAAIRYFNTPHGAWFDQVVDLSHHGGLAFNKGYIWEQSFSQSVYKEMLNCKSDSSIFDWKPGMPLVRPEELKWLLWAVGGTEEYGPTVKRFSWTGTEAVNVQLNRDYLDEDEEVNEERTERRTKEREAEPKWKLERPD